MINCGHYPITFVPGYSRMREPTQDEETNNKEYEESQKQRALERNLRGYRRDLEVAKKRNDPVAIEKAQAKVDTASDALDSFCDETGRKRRRNREYTPINATFPDI